VCDSRENPYDCFDGNVNKEYVRNCGQVKPNEISDVCVTLRISERKITSSMMSPVI